MNKDNKKGDVYYSRNILSSIVQLAVEEVDGVAYYREEETDKKKSNMRSRPDVRIEFCKEGIYVDVSVAVMQDCVVPDVAYAIQVNVKRGVETMTKFKVLAVNVSVIDVKFRGEVN